MATESRTNDIQDRKEVFKVDNCRACDNPDLTTFLQLGPTPAPNGFLEAPDLDRAEKFYPLDVAFCGDCGMVQLGHVVSPEVMFRNYVYIPSTSRTMTEHFAEMAESVSRKAQASKEDLAVDIGSNDGTLLKNFQRIGIQALGVDPAENLVKKANEEGVETINALFNSRVASEIRQEKGPAKIITGTNVVAHVHDLHDFFEGVHNLLAEDGMFVAEFPYLVDLLDKGEFDTIYQEHLSYLAVSPIDRLISRHGLKVFDVQRTEVHGGSLRLFAAKDGVAVEPSVRRFIETEEQRGIRNPETYLQFRRGVDRIRHNLVQLLWGLRLEDKRIVGYGASAKGNIMLNYCRIGPETLDYVVDSIPYKQGKFTPGMHIPIVPENRLLEDQPDYALLLAWNFADEIIAKQAEYRKNGGKFVLTIPEVKAVE